ncbi:unnamed protein product, partial [Rotaria sordida]
MSGQKWTDLTDAYNMCLAKRLEIAQQSSKDFVSIIQFNDGARIIYSASPLSNGIPQLAHMARGGTSFSPALQKAMEVLNEVTDGYIPVLLFMSDGQGKGGPSEMAGIYTNYKSRGLQVHTIAFGKDADTATLGQLAYAAHGKFHKCITGAELAKT